MIPEPAPEPQAETPPETQEQRAQRAIEAIMSGSDLTLEALTLSNEFTDRQTARLKNWVRRTPN